MSVDPRDSGSVASMPFRPGLFDPPAGETPARLIVGVCATCGRSYFPARAHCPECGEGGRVEELRVSGAGAIYASTIVRVPSPVGLEPPYAYGYVDLDDARLRVFGLFTTVVPDELQPGTRVEMVIAPLRKDAGGRELLAYKFRPVTRSAR